MPFADTPKPSQRQPGAIASPTPSSNMPTAPAAVMGSKSPAPLIPMLILPEVMTAPRVGIRISPLALERLILPAASHSVRFAPRLPVSMRLAVISPKAVMLILPPWDAPLVLIVPAVILPLKLEILTAPPVKPTLLLKESLGTVRISPVKTILLFALTVTSPPTVISDLEVSMLMPLMPPFTLAILTVPPLSILEKLIS